MRVTKSLISFFVVLLSVVATSPALADSISGTVGNNTGGYGDTTLIPSVGVTVYADLNNNKSKDAGEPYVATDSSGAYSIDLLPAGSYRVRFIPSTGYACVQMEGYCSSSLLAVTEGGEAVFSEQNLHQFKASATAQGSTFNDTNRNGTKDRGEAAIAGITVFQDINGNAVLDGGEPSAASAGSAGAWSLKVTPGHAQVLTVGGATSQAMGEPRVISGLSTATSVSAGVFGSCALLANHTIKCWGDNSYGSLGNGNAPDADMPVFLTPQAVVGISNAAQVSSRGMSPCSVSSGGSVWCWGDNSSGQLGDGTTNSSNTPVQVDGISNASQMDTGYATACSILQNAEVWCWGSNGSGVYSADGSYDNDPHSVPHKIIDGATKISVSDAACVIKIDQTVWCWGTAGDLGLADGAPAQVPGLSNAIDIVVSGDSACTLITGGTVKCWGGGSNGLLGNGIANESNYTPTNVPGLSGVSKLTGDLYGVVCATITNGDVKCWGSSEQGQFGAIAYSSPGFGINNYNLGFQASPVTVAGFKNSTSLGAGGYNLCGKVSSEVKCSGFYYGLWWGALSRQSFTDGATTAVGALGIGKTLASPSITTKPAELTGAASANFTTSFKSGTLGFCRLDDDSSWHGMSYDSVNCANYTASGLADGPHTFTIMQVDLSAGMVFSNPVSYTWTVNSTPPAVPTVNIKPAATTASTAAGMSFSGDKGNTFSCKVDDGSWATCASTLYLAGLADGSHSVQIKQINSLGISSSATSVDWTQSATHYPIKTTATFTAGTTGDSLSCANSVVTSKNQSKVYAWIKDGSVVGNATRLTVADSMWGNDVTCVAFVISGSTSTAYPATAWNRALPLPVATSTTVARRTTKTGSTVSCTAGKWKYGPVTLSYQWLRDGVNITNATSATYTLTGDDTGKSVACKVTATNATGSTSNTKVLT